MEKTTRQILEEYLDIAYSYREKMQIILVCNVDCKFRFIGSPIPLATDQCFRS